MKILEFEEEYDYDDYFAQRLNHYMAMHREAADNSAIENQHLKDELIKREQLRHLRLLMTLTFDMEPFGRNHQNDILLILQREFRDKLNEYKVKPVKNYFKHDLPKLLERNEGTVKHIISSDSILKYDFVDWKKEQTIEFLAETFALSNLQDEFDPPSNGEDQIDGYSINQAVAIVFTLLETKYDKDVDTPIGTALATVISKLIGVKEESVRPAVSEAINNKTIVTGKSFDGIRADLKRLKLKSLDLGFIDACIKRGRDK